MASFYLRMNNFLEKGYRPEANLPERLKGQVRVNAPMLPEWMGDTIFVDPLQLALPFKQWAYAVDQYTGNENKDIGRANRVLEELLNDQEITQEQYARALETQTGPEWDRAVSLARLDDTEGRTSMFDFMSMMTAPHAPIAWAHNALKGTPEEIGPALPLTRTVKGVTAMLGIGEPGGVDIEGNIREHFGLPRFDAWDDYRANRMLSNMVATGEITSLQARQAMISKEGEIYLEARDRAGKEFGVGALGSAIGIPLKAYPPGEEHLRKLKDDYEAAWVSYKEGDDTAINDFHRENPGYEARQLALEFDPERQLRQFLEDEIWDRWHDMPTQHKIEMADGLGDLFETAFLDKETRAIDQIPSDTMGAWLQIMGGESPIMAEWDQDLHPIELTPPAVAQRLQGFYLTRTENFRYNRNVAPLWDTYFSLEKDARKDFFRQNPILEQYIDWRNDFMARNPDLAPYIEDDPEKLPQYPSEEALQEAQQAQPNLTEFEWQNVLGLPAYNLVLDVFDGEELPQIARDRLDDAAQQLGMNGWLEVVNQMEASLAQPQQ